MTAGSRRNTAYRAGQRCSGRRRHRALAWLAATGLGAGVLPAEAVREAPLLLTQAPASSDMSRSPRAAGWSPDRDFDGARVAIIQPDGEVRVLSEGFQSACDPSLSFDAQKVLFSGKKDPGSRWRVHEVGLDGKGLRPVTPEHLDARSPIHVSTLFTLDSPEPWFTTVFVGAETGPTGLTAPHTPRVWNLYNVKLDGGDLRRLTWTPHASLDPFQMWDGRVVYAAERRAFPPSRGPARLGLFAIHLEGADLELYGAAQGQRIQRMPCATEGGLVVFVESEGPGLDRGGQLACVTERRPHTEYQRLTQDDGRLYAHPFPWKGNTVLVSSRSTRDGDTWGVWTFDADARTGALLHDDPQFDDLQARLVLPRPRPDGHSTVVNMTATTGTFYGLNCYTADARLAPHVRAGEVKRVRFLEGVLPERAGGGVPKSTAPSVRRRLVGEAPVEADGSFNVEVPASTPLLLQTLDERGLALATCGWIWVQPKETRGCIGCHEDPERIPENEYVLALRRPSNRLTLPPEQRRALSFRDHIAPLLQQQCVLADCHGGPNTPLHLDLTSGRPGSQEFERAYLTLTTATRSDAATPPYVTPGHARTSPLVWHLFGGNTSRPWDAASATNSGPVKLMPPPTMGRTLRPEEIRTVVQWIDLGAPYDVAGGPVGGVPLQQAQTQ